MYYVTTNCTVLYTCVWFIIPVTIHQGYDKIWKRPKGQNVTAQAQGHDPVAHFCKSDVASVSLAKDDGSVQERVMFFAR